MAAFSLFRTGLVLIEPESLAEDLSSGWIIRPDGAASGGQVVQAGADALPKPDAPGAAPAFSITVQVAEPGTWYLSLRGAAQGLLAEGEAVSVALDGVALASAGALAPAARGYLWGTPLAVPITTAGTHSLTLAAWQPGLALDALALSADPLLRPGERQARTAGSFLDSIGVNTHLGWYDSRYADLGAVTKALQYLGITQVRDTIGDAHVGARFDQLGAAGIRADILIPHRVEGVAPGQELEWAVARIREHAWMARAIEGPNEVDFAPVQRDGLTGFAAADETMRDLYAMKLADPVLRHIPVLQYTIGDFSLYADRTDLSAFADYGTTHAYTGDASPPGDGIGFATRLAQPLNGADPVITTETGYGTSPVPSYGRVSEAVQAKYIPRLLAEQFAQGIEATYLYQLFDPFEGVDPFTGFFNYYGLYRTNGTAKPAAVALHRLTTWLADPGAKPFAAGTLDYTLRGAPETLGSTLLQKSDGTFMLMLWNDVKNYDSDTGGDIAAAPARVELDFGGAPRSLVLRDTLTGASTVMQAGQRISLDVPDHVVLLQIRGVPGATAPSLLPVTAAAPLPGPPPLDTTIGFGSDSLVLHLSQDFGRGAAQYTVSVDGVQQGGVLTAQAFRSDGHADRLTLRGEWAPGEHLVTLTLVNGTADRALYLEAAAYDGETIAGAPLGAVSAAAFTVRDSTATTPAPRIATIGAGVDSMVLRLAQDAWSGDARYTIAVDGVRIGGVQTAAAYQATGQADTLTVRGDWATGPHEFTIAFINDAYGGAGMDRNLYLLDAEYNGVAVPALPRGHVWTSRFAFEDVPPAPAAISLGSGSDSLVLRISQDAWRQNARYTVAVDGQRIGGVLTASAHHAAGQSDTVTVKGNWALGPHEMTLAFANDGQGSLPGQDRNLYLDAVTYNGQSVEAPLGSVAPATRFRVLDLPPPPKQVEIGSGTDALVLRIAQDAHQGDAQYVISVDGVRQGGVQGAAAYHATGETDQVTIRGDWKLGPHEVTLAFVNPEAAGLRHLYLEGAAYNGVALAGGAPGAVTTTRLGFIDVAPAPRIATIGEGPDALVLRLSQDAWQGNAQYNVAVDGVEIGGVQTASAYRAAGQGDVLTVRGDWATGPHAVAVRFLNDAYGGAPTRDRNLYLDEVSYDGRPVATYTGAIGAVAFEVHDTGVWG